MLLDKIIVLQLEVPSCLLFIKFVQFSKVLEIFMIYLDFELFIGIQ